MTDQQDDSLLERADSQDSVVNVITPRRTPPSDLKIAGFILLACLLIAGQGLTAYFVLNQKGQISNLEKNTDNLKSQLARRANVQSASKIKMSMPMYNMPMLMDVLADKKKTPIVKLEDTVMVSLEKQVKDLLQDAQLPQFNETFLANLKGMKKQMEESDWKGFESWMHHWLVFQMAQQKHPAPTPVPGPATTGESTLKTKCQSEAEKKQSTPWLGGYFPKCDEQGNYYPMQCWHSTGYCWCVDANGEEIAGTASRERRQCGGLSVPDKMMAFPSLTRMMEMKDD
ncbi:hypothetical protein AAFF_G00319500 [Aldrovandia affinis]|uniref:Thyroglobulin type-1 domain-containing protein n=1 Tax=Aldrovandia affinis TaxID=143900 RepID=A0AAD7WQF3_9TELE|nr:hypothetical protein AAFF_G00319500 [Aldrovandia affinis]